MTHRLPIHAARFAFAAALLCSCAPRVQAAFHAWRFNEIFSNQDGSIQFIELRCQAGFNFEHAVKNHPLRSDANTFNVPSNLAPTNVPTGGRLFLFATAGFAELPGAVTPDFIIPDGFFDPAGDALNWASVDTFAFESGDLPLDGRMSLLDNLTTAINTPTNFAGDVGEIDLTPAPTPGDTDGDGDVDLDDLNNVRNNFGSVGDPILGDTDTDGDVDLDDLNAVRNNFGAAGSASVPEPTAGALAAFGVLAIALQRARRAR